LGGDSSNPSSVGTGGATGSLGQGTPSSNSSSRKNSPAHEQVRNNNAMELTTKTDCQDFSNVDAPKGPQGHARGHNEQHRINSNRVQYEHAYVGREPHTAPAVTYLPVRSFRILTRSGHVPAEGAVTYVLADGFAPTKGHTRHKIEC
jgi:hypothetical protein